MNQSSIWFKIKQVTIERFQSLGIHAVFVLWDKFKRYVQAVSSVPIMLLFFQIKLASFAWLVAPCPLYEVTFLAAVWFNFSFVSKTVAWSVCCSLWVKVKLRLCSWGEMAIEVRMTSERPSAEGCDGVENSEAPGGYQAYCFPYSACGVFCLLLAPVTAGERFSPLRT